VAKNLKGSHRNILFLENKLQTIEYTLHNVLTNKIISMSYEHKINKKKKRKIINCVHSRYQFLKLKTENILEKICCHAS